MATDKVKGNSRRSSNAWAPVVRGLLVTTGIVAFAYGIPDLWDSLASSVGTGLRWVSEHIWGVAGVLVALVGIGWRSGWDFLGWAVGLILPPWRLLGVIALLVGTTLVALDTIHGHDIGLLMVITPLWIGAGLVTLPSTTTDNNPTDQLHRAHMVGRLAEFLIKLPPNARRIGILGPWGEGKSFVLRLLQRELQDRDANKTFRMAWVNPWRATSSKDAWEEIARGFDRALGFPRLLPHSLLAIPGLGALLALLPWPLAGLTNDLKALLTSGGDDAKRIATGIERFLKRRKQWLLIFVDDMERVGEEQLRKMFPVIDRLGEIERCYFVFAIDPDRVAKAFEEDAGNTDDESKGYLDKVLDFQFTLPPASHAEVLGALTELSNAVTCPRLTAALPKIREYLPRNPRQATRFQREAEAREIMFLSRFGIEEHNYEGFFLLLLIELQFQDVHSKLQKALDDNIGTLGLKAVFGIESGSEDAKKGLRQVKEAVCGSIDGDTKAALDPLLERVFALCIEPSRFLEGERPLHRDWAFEGYRKLLRFTLEERERFLASWKKNAGGASLKEMLADVRDGEPFGEPEKATAQALTIEIENIRDQLGDAYPMVHNDHDLAPLESEIVTRMHRLRDHGKAATAGNLEALDQEVFGNWLMAPWMEAVERNSLHGLPQDFRQAVQRARAEVTEALADALPPRERFVWCRDASQRLRGIDRKEIREAFREELEPVRNAVLSRFTDEVAELFERADLLDAFPPEFLTRTTHDALHDPQAWLFPTSKRGEEVLTELVAEAATNPTAHANFVMLVRHAILSPFGISRNENVVAQAERRKSIKAHPWYLKLCWEGVWAREPSGDDRRAIERLLRKAIKIENEVVAAGEESVIDVLESLEVPEEPTSTEQSES